MCLSMHAYLLRLRAAGVRLAARIDTGKFARARRKQSRLITGKSVISCQPCSAPAAGPGHTSLLKEGGAAAAEAWRGSSHPAREVPERAGDGGGILLCPQASQLHCF